jgi:glycosyltransferase involved in cell wall biosynthesis
MPYREFGAVIPAFNEQEHIGEVISKILKYLPRDHIVVVDDGSIDDTTEVAKSMGIRVINHSQNCGKGASLRTGFDYIVGIDDIEGVFVLDADGQHDPDEIPLFIEKFNKGNYDIIIGNRMRIRKKMPLIRKFTNFLTSFVISLRTRCKIEDSQSGYRLISSPLLKSVNLVTTHYETESELLIKARKNNAVIGSVQISSIYKGEESKINPLVDTLRFLILVFRSFFW